MCHTSTYQPLLYCRPTTKRRIIRVSYYLELKNYILKIDMERNRIQRPAEIFINVVMYSINRMSPIRKFKPSLPSGHRFKDIGAINGSGIVAINFINKVMQLIQITIPLQGDVNRNKSSNRKIHDPIMGSYSGNTNRTSWVFSQ